MVHAIKYRETYECTYFVQADTFDEACEKLKNAVYNGEIKGPEYCCDVECKNDGKNWDNETLNDPDCLDLE